MRILFLRLGAIGDLVQCAIAIALFKKENPCAEVHWVVSHPMAPFVKALGVADRILTVNYDGLVSGSFFSRVKNLIKEALKLRGSGQFSKLINAHADYRYSLLTSLVKVHDRKSADRPFPIVHRYRVYEYFRLLSHKDSTHVDFNAGIQVIYKNLMLECGGANNPTLSNYVVLAPGGAKNLLSDNPLRRWPLENFVALAKKFRTIGMQVLIVGGSSDAFVSEAFVGSDVVDLVGQTDLVALFRLMNLSRGIVTHDSGPMHIASITRAPLVAIFGPTPANAFLAFARSNTVVLHQENRVSCSPCYDGKTYATCVNNICMAEIGVDLVFKSLLKMSV